MTCEGKDESYLAHADKITIAGHATYHSEQMARVVLEGIQNGIYSEEMGLELEHHRQRMLFLDRLCRLYYDISPFNSIVEKISGTSIERIEQYLEDK
jgi:hypothetical protein